MIANKAAAKEQELIRQRDASKVTRSDTELKDLESIKAEFAKNAERQRSDANKIFTRQDEIAARNANMAVGQAGESGLQISE